MARKPDEVERFIALIREIDPKYLRDLFRDGGCYHLYKILRVHWPQATPLFSDTEDHVYVFIDDKAYDIRGRREAPGDVRPMSLLDCEQADRWLANRHAFHGEFHDGCTEPSIKTRSILSRELRMLRSLPFGIAEKRFVALVTNSIPEDEKAAKRGVDLREE